MKNNKRFGVGLSGGGYRAAAFHLGTLKKLHQLELLDKMDVLSTISGGSITGAACSLSKTDFDTFEKMMVNTLSQKSIIKYALTSRQFFVAVCFCLLFIIPGVWLLFTKWATLSVPVLALFCILLLKYQFRIFPVSKIIEKAYKDFFYGEATLRDLCGNLCKDTEVAIGSTNLQTSRPFTFSRRKMEDSYYANLNPPIKFYHADFPVARAVMASSCVPFAFTPVVIDEKFFVDYQLGLERKVKPELVDGGVYDNQGVQKLTQDGSSYSCDIVLISDAGNKLPFAKAYNNTFTLLLRTVDTFMMRIKNFQMAQNIFQEPLKREVAYQSLGWDIENCIPGFVRNLKSGKICDEVIAFHELDEDWVKNTTKFEAQINMHMENRYYTNNIKKQCLSPNDLKAIRKIGTNLTPISKELVQKLIIHSACLTELQLYLYCPSLFQHQ